MKIVHIAPTSPYNDYWGYQDNLLPKYHRKLGHEVAIITTNLMHEDGKKVKTECSTYTLEDGVKVIRCPYKKYPGRILTIWNARLVGVYTLLKELQPEFIFFHGLVSTTIFDAIRYKKKILPSCIIVQDNHQDYNIGMRRNGLKDSLVCSWYRFINRISIKNVEKVYGVTPWRKTYAEDYFQIPTSKTDVLIMGADDEKIDFGQRDIIRRQIRDQYDINEDEFLIVTGGKIDMKKGIHLLMRAAGEINGVKLIIFGQVDDELKDEFDRLLNDYSNIIYIGWLEADKVYNYFFAADIVMFPGQHSVLWEQACASKVPCVFEKWDGMEHVNNGGNSDFFDTISIDDIEKKIKELLFTPAYEKMKTVAMSEKTDIYLYSKIAAKSLECRLEIDGINTQ